MNNRVWLSVCLLLLAACSDGPDRTSAPAQQGFAGLGLAADAFATVERGGELAFPQDHAAHPEFRIEWWYVTANLEDREGRQYGMQWTLFRQALTPDGELGHWQDGQVWMAHVGLTGANEHWHAERFGRSGGGQTGVTTQPTYQVWLDDWSLQSVTAPGSPERGDPLEHIRVQASTDDFAFDLVLQTDQPLVLQGDAGYSLKSERGQASWYYSQPFYQVNGTLTLADASALTVHGTGWLDREWSSQPLAPEQTGWDWFSLQLPDNERLMLFRLREQDNPDSYFAGTHIGSDGSTRPLAPEEIRMQPLETTQVAGRQVPTAWHLEVPVINLSIETRPLNPRAWMDTSIPYWEGPITFSGSHSGRGYLEMTGY